MDSPSPDNSSRHLDRSRLVACRECRRSKIRCSRVFPCEACTRRGCTDICPGGVKETKRSKPDETLLQENARLVRRIRHLEGVLLSLKHPAGLPSSSDDTSLCPPSPGQDSQSSEISPSSDFSDPMLFDVLGSSHDRDTNSESLVLEPSRVITGNNENSLTRREIFDRTHGSMKALETQLMQNKAILAPGCQFVLQALLDLCRTCGVIDNHSSNDKNTVSDTPSSAVSEGDQSLFSTLAPASSPLSGGPLSETPLSQAESDASIGDPASKNGTEEIAWDFANMMSTVSSSSMGDRAHPTTPPVLGQFGGSSFHSNQSDSRQPSDPMSAELCQRLLVELGIAQESGHIHDVPGAYVP